MKSSHWWLMLIAGVTLLLVPIAGGAWLLSNQVPTVVEGWQSRSWPGAPARVEHSVAIHKYAPSRSRRGGQGTHVMELRYGYLVEGRQYTGQRRSLDHEHKIYQEKSADLLAKQTPLGSAVAAYYDPADPARSLLEPGVPVGGVTASLFGLSLFGGGLYVMRMMVRGLLSWRPRRRVKYA